MYTLDNITKTIDRYTKLVQDTLDRLDVTGTPDVYYDKNIKHGYNFCICFYIGEIRAGGAFLDNEDSRAKKIIENFIYHK